MVNQKTSTKIALFKGRQIRRHWNENKEKWYFSVVDVVAVLSGSVDPRNYWKVLKNRLKNEGSQVVTKCNQLKMPASDGKYYLTDVADTETMFRLIQSIPSPQAEPFKLWLARVGYERIQEIENPELAISLSFPRKRESRSYRYRFPIKSGMTEWIINKTYISNLLYLYTCKQKKWNVIYRSY